MKNKFIRLFKVYIKAPPPSHTHTIKNSPLYNGFWFNWHTFTPWLITVHWRYFTKYRFNNSPINNPYHNKRSTCLLDALLGITCFDYRGMTSTARRSPVKGIRNEHATVHWFNIVLKILEFCDNLKLELTHEDCALFEWQLYRLDVSDTEHFNNVL